MPQTQIATNVISPLHSNISSPFEKLYYLSLTRKWRSRRQLEVDEIFWAVVWNTPFKAKRKKTMAVRVKAGLKYKYEVDVGQRNLLGQQPQCLKRFQSAFFLNHKTNFYDMLFNVHQQAESSFRIRCSCATRQTARNRLSWTLGNTFSKTCAAILVVAIISIFVLLPPSVTLSVGVPGSKVNS